MSRSEIFTKAAQRYAEQIEDESTTKQVDAALDLIDESHDSNQAAVTGSRRTAAGLGDDW